MNRRKLFLRILVSPFILGLLSVTYTYGMFKQWLLFLRYGGEWLTYAKEDAVTMKDIFNELKKSHEAK